MALLRRFVVSESGATAVEYGLIVAIIAAFIIGTMTAFQDRLAATYTKIKDAMP